MSKPPVHVGQIVRVTVDRLVFGGAGLARFEGFVIFIPFTVPGDVVDARITLVKKGFAEATVSNLISPSSDRIQALCPYFTKCGGCDWLNLSYKNQLIHKEQIVRDALRKAKLEIKNLLPILESPLEFRYRNRIQIQQINGRTGFRAPQSHEVIDIEDCLIAEEPLITSLKELRKKSSTKPKRWDIRKIQDGSVYASVVGEEEQELGFAQVNTRQNDNMISILDKLVQNKNYDTVLDLYAGSGNLTFPVYKTLQPQNTHAVEFNSRAVREGQKQAQKLNIPVNFHESSVDLYLNKFKKQGTLLTIIDPPRAGAGAEVMKRLAHLRPEALIYVSCDPMTFARDVNILLQETKNTYKIQFLQPLDMFPQTYHVEIISMIVPT